MPPVSCVAGAGGGSLTGTTGRGCRQFGAAIRGRFLGGKGCGITVGTLFLGAHGQLGIAAGIGCLTPHATGLGALGNLFLGNLGLLTPHAT